MSNQNLVSIHTISEAKEVLKSNIAVLFYFSTKSCAVGEALEPKVYDVLNTDFPNIKYFKIDLNFSPELSAHYNAFMEPTILVFFEGKETIRKSRNISIFELDENINRYYKLIFE